MFAGGDGQGRQKFQRARYVDLPISGAVRGKRVVRGRAERLDPPLRQSALPLTVIVAFAGILACPRCPESLSRTKTTDIAGFRWRVFSGGARCLAGLAVLAPPP